MLRLPLEQREALILCAVDGLEVAEAAEALGIPIDTVKTRLRRARLALVEARTRLSTLQAREGRGGETAREGRDERQTEESP